MTPLNPRPPIRNNLPRPLRKPRLHTPQSQKSPQKPPPQRLPPSRSAMRARRRIPWQREQSGTDDEEGGGGGGALARSGIVILRHVAEQRFRRAGSRARDGICAFLLKVCAVEPDIIQALISLCRVRLEGPERGLEDLFGVWGVGFGEEVGGWVGVGGEVEGGHGAGGEGGGVCDGGEDGGLLGGVAAAKGDVVGPLETLLGVVAGEEGGGCCEGGEG